MTVVCFKMTLQIKLDTERETYSPGSLIKGDLVVNVEEETKVESIKVSLEGVATSIIVQQVDWNRRETVEEHKFIQLDQYMLEKRLDGHRYQLHRAIDTFPFMFNLPHDTTCASKLIDDQQTLIGLSSASQSDDICDALSLVPVLTTEHLSREHTESLLPATFHYRNYQNGNSFDVEYTIKVVVKFSQSLKAFTVAFPFKVEPIEVQIPVDEDHVVRVCSDLLKFGHGLLHRSEPDVPFHIVAQFPSILHREFEVRIFVVFPREIRSLSGVVLKDLTIKLKSALSMRAQGVYTLEKKKMVLFEKTIALEECQLITTPDEGSSQRRKALGSLNGQYIEFATKIRGIPSTTQDFKVCNGVLGHRLSIQGRLGVKKSMKQSFKLEENVCIL